MPELLEVRYALSALPPQMSWWNFLPAILLLATVPLSAQTSKPEYLSNSNHMCKATLADGTPYEHWQRIFVTQWNGQTVYAWVEGYYRPGSGEFFGAAQVTQKRDITTSNPISKPQIPVKRPILTPCFCRMVNGQISGLRTEGSLFFTAT